MRITLAALSDWAATTDKGKLVVGGVFDTIPVRQLPSRHPMMTLALRMRSEPGEAPNHEVTVRLVDPDGEQLVPELKGRVTLQRVSPGEGASMQFVLHLPNVPLSKFGPHAVDIFVDGEHMESLPLYVKQIRPRERPVRGRSDGDVSDVPEATGSGAEDIDAPDDEYRPEPDAGAE